MNSHNWPVAAINFDSRGPAFNARVKIVNLKAAWLLSYSNSRLMFRICPILYQVLFVWRQIEFLVVWRWHWSLKMSANRYHAALLVKVAYFSKLYWGHLWHLLRLLYKTTPNHLSWRPSMLLIPFVIIRCWNFMSYDIRVIVLVFLAWAKVV